MKTLLIAAALLGWATSPLLAQRPKPYRPATLVKSPSVNRRDAVTSQAVNPPAIDLDDTPLAADSMVERRVYTYVEQMPELPGGRGQGFIVTAVQQAVKYSPLALHNRVEGSIFVSFTVSSQGYVRDVKIVKGLGSGLDEETARAVYQLPRFFPGKQAGKVVAVSFTVPILFQLPAEPDPAP